ncbi:uncharacterized protein LOC143558718 [Bidens hawaiensis]|uniref:uncharacterized protein LOC143558718 n=1 Tax=Bidens hawaiensis TaxID=980011 RepID=UPI00404B39FA
MPVYNWLESLNTDEVVSKIQVQDWLTANAEIMRDVLGKYPGYHLVHYIRKCHKKILKKRDKKEGLHTRVKKRSSKAHKTEEKKSLAKPPSSSATKLPKDSPTYMVKRNEAFQKYQILTEMEKQLSAMFQNQETAKVVTGP